MKKVAIGFSGGVDSLMSALYLKEMGYDVYAFTLMFNEQQYSVQFRNYVQSAAALLKIKLFFINEEQTFQQIVINYYKKGYLAGETPNPCVYCNIYLKWPQLFRCARKVGAEKIATGHYAKIGTLAHHKVIQKGDDPEKDQSFFLWGLTPADLHKVIFPLAEKKKEFVKLEAQKLGFSEFASQKESTGPCFGNAKNARTIRNLFNEDELPGKGNFITPESEVIGRHEGYPFYTISQRKGLGLKTDKRYFVQRKIPEKNQVVLSGPGALWSDVFYLRDYRIHFPQIVLNETLEIKIRYRGQYAEGKIEKQGELLLVRLNKPEWAIASGQTAALYYNDFLVGGGFIV